MAEDGNPAPTIVDDLPETSNATQGRAVKLSAIKNFAIDFLTDEEMAARLEMHVDTWRELLTDTRVKYAVKAGKALGRAIIKMQSRKLMLVQGSSGVSMTVHLRKVHFGESEKGLAAAADKNESRKVVIEGGLPGGDYGDLAQPAAEVAAPPASSPSAKDDGLA